MQENNKSLSLVEVYLQYGRSKVSKIRVEHRQVFMKDSAILEFMFLNSCFECDLIVTVKYQNYIEEGIRQGIRGVPVD